MLATSYTTNPIPRGPNLARSNKDQPIIPTVDQSSISDPDLIFLSYLNLTPSISTSTAAAASGASGVGDKRRAVILSPLPPASSSSSSSSSSSLPFKKVRTGHQEGGEEDTVTNTNLVIITPSSSSSSSSSSSFEGEYGQEHGRNLDLVTNPTPSHQSYHSNQSILSCTLGESGSCPSPWP